jgi:hypothetical protein
MSHVQWIVQRAAMSRRSRLRSRGLPAALSAALATLVAAALLAACGSSSKSTAASAPTGRQACKQVEAALSDGPEPEADPVGYAQAQILPLHRIHTTDAQLASAIGGLASAYEQFTASKGSHQAKNAVNNATKTIEALCPGIAP